MASSRPIPSLLAVALTLGPTACLDDYGAASVDTPPATMRGAALLDGPGVQVTVRAREFACSASAQCRGSFLPELAGDGRADALTTGLSCAFDPHAGPFPRDTLVAFASRVRCYDDGDLADPDTWRPPGGVEPDPAALAEQAYADSIGPYGDVYVNTASRLGAADPFAFCTFEAWAVLDSAHDDGGPRTVHHAQGASAIRWQLVIAPRADDAGYDCLATDPVAELRVAAVTRDLPDPDARGQLPATFDAAILREATLTTNHPDGAPVTHGGLRLVALLAARFPPARDAPLATFTERALWVADPDTGAPLGVAVRRSCAELDPGSGRLAAIAVLLRDAADADAGGLLVHAHHGAPFECDREPSGACRLLTVEALAAAAPCVLGGAQ